MIAHLQTIAWLQFRLIKNSASRNARWLGAFAWVIQVALSTMGCVFITIVAFGAGFITDDEKSAWLLVAIIDGGVVLVLLVRSVMLMVELTEADFIDTGKLLFLPIRLRTLFGINFIVRNFSGIVLIVMPPLFALCGSLSIIHGPRMLLGIPLGLVTLLAIVTWFGFFREGLLTLSENRKRAVTTAVIMLLSGTMGAVGIGGIYAKLRVEATTPVGVAKEKVAALENSERPELADDNLTERQIRYVLLQGNAWVPLGWFPLGMYQMIEHRYGVALSGGMAMGLIALAGIALEYRLVRKRYRGAISGANTSTKKKPVQTSKWTRFALPRFGNDWAAFTGLTYLVRTRTFTFRSSNWFYGIIAIAASCVPLITDVSSLRGYWWNELTPYAIGAPILFFGVAMFINLFGHDRTGFQVLVLLPVKRHVYILCKNGIMTAFIVLWFAMLTVPCVLIFRPHPVAIVAAFLITLQAVAILTILGNGLSIAFPFRLKEGQLDQPAQPLAAILPSFLGMLGMPFVFAPMAITALLGSASGWVWGIEGAWISLAIALLFLVPTLCIYAASIPATAALLKSREMRMLEILASDRE